MWLEAVCEEDDSSRSLQIDRLIIQNRRMLQVHMLRQQYVVYSANMHSSYVSTQCSRHDFLIPGVRTTGRDGDIAIG